MGNGLSPIERNSRRNRCQLFRFDREQIKKGYDYKNSDDKKDEKNRKFHQIPFFNRMFFKAKPSFSCESM